MRMEQQAGNTAQEGNAAGGHHDMMRMRFDAELWTQFANLVLGAWLIMAPLSFGYRSAELLWSDLASGALVLVLGTLSLSYERPWARWGVCFVGIWLLFAPLVFWAPSAAAYANDTLVGTLLISFSILVPGMPGMRMLPGPVTPPGWSYNPSSWHQRGPMIALALFGFFVSRHLAAFQLGHIDTAWDPFFGPGTERILESEVSRAWPISDAGLGAVAYMIEALSGFMGGVQRWRTMPWMVALFGFLVIPLGVTSIVLVILQPVAVGTWCTLCLATAVAMLIMIPLAVDEVVAMAQFVTRRVDAGESFWRVFWLGGTEEGGEEDSRTPPPHAPLARAVPAMVWGVTVPWGLLAAALLGIGVMAMPALLGTAGALADSSHLTGALITTVAVVAMAEVVRAGRLLNLLLGAWVIAAPWLLSGGDASARWAGLAIGLLVILSSLPLGPVRERYGEWNRRIV